MAGSRASVLGEAEDFQAALSAEGVVGMLFTGRGQFRARLTQVALKRWRLAAVQEAQSRIAFIAVPPGRVLVSFPLNGGPSPIWGGVEIHIDEIVAFGPGERLHARTVGACRWAVSQVPEQRLADYGCVLGGTRFVVPPAARWRPPRAATKQLRGLHGAAIRLAEARAAAITDLQAAHELEQQLLHALIDCLSTRSEKETATGRNHRDVLARFEDVLAAKPFLPITEICATLSVSERTLRECCRKHLGMGPASYRHLRAMQQVYRALRKGGPDAASVSEVARQHGFCGLGRFAAKYRAIYGELPSATLQRASNPGTIAL
jgi:AraC-like DNA-binding protein